MEQVPYFIFAFLFTTLAMAADAPAPTATPIASPAPKYAHIVREKGPLCVEQVYGCADKKCEKPVILETIMNECTRSKKAKAAMGQLADKWQYLHFDHTTPPAGKKPAANITTTVKDPEPKSSLKPAEGTQEVSK